MNLDIDTSEVDKNLEQYLVKSLAAIDMYSKTAAASLETYAKRNRPWTDRTNRARQGLTGSNEMTATSVRVVLAHTVDYGLWLELAHEKKYAIVEPTVRLKSNEIVNGMNLLLDRIKL